ncbi:MAG: glucose 1-dehydrogenase [Phycisphaerae bacterium]|nr:glucose 1-dehydrogenase [Phycisphaerae bacterium]
MARFSGKVALVTGGGTGIGKATAIAFAKDGAKVVIANRNEANGRAVADQIRKAGGEAVFVRTDVTREADIEAAVRETVAKYGRLDIAFNNSGTEGNGSWVAEETVENYNTVFNANVLGVLLSMKHEIRQMRKQGGGGAIINNGSIASSIGMPGAAVYIASKHAVLGLTRSAALEVAKEGIRINQVSPGGIETEMLDRFTQAPGMREYLTNLHPVGRLGKSEEIASAVLWLASSESSFVNGHDLRVDGGFTVP